MHFTKAIVRCPAASCGAGLTTAQSGAPDYARTLTQFNRSDAYGTSMSRRHEAFQR